jgi:hypothetical protein
MVDSRGVLDSRGGFKLFLPRVGFDLELRWMLS